MDSYFRIKNFCSQHASGVDRAPVDFSVEVRDDIVEFALLAERAPFRVDAHLALRVQVLVFRDLIDILHAFHVTGVRSGT